LPVGDGICRAAQGALAEAGGFAEGEYLPGGERFGGEELAEEGLGVGAGRGGGRALQ